MSGTSERIVPRGIVGNDCGNLLSACPTEVAHPLGSTLLPNVSAGTHKPTPWLTNPGMLPRFAAMQLGRRCFLVSEGSERNRDVLKRWPSENGSETDREA